MATIEVKNLDGKSVGKVDLDDSVFGVEVNEHLLWEVVKAQRAKRRAGTHSTKRRDEVRFGQRRHLGPALVGAGCERHAAEKTQQSGLRRLRTPLCELQRTLLADAA